MKRIVLITFLVYVALIGLIPNTVQAADTIEYTLDNGWVYESTYTTFSDNAPSPGITVDINVPVFTAEGGLGGSEHDLPGFSLSDNNFAELNYNSFTTPVI
jgi:hypothetical protein